MFKGADVYCTRYLTQVFPATPGWTVPKNFATRLNEFKQVIDAIERLAVEQVYHETGAKAAATRVKKAQEMLRTQLMVIRQAARALTWAIPGLDTKCRLPALRARRAEWHEAVQIILEAARPHLDILIDEGVPANTLEKIAAADADFATAVAESTTTRQRRSAITKEFPKLVTKGHQLVASLSVTINAFHAYANDLAGAATWAQARHVRRDPRRSQKNQPATKPVTTNDCGEVIESVTLGEMT